MRPFQAKQVTLYPISGQLLDFYRTKTRFLYSLLCLIAVFHLISGISITLRYNLVNLFNQCWRTPFCHANPPVNGLIYQPKMRKQDIEWKSIIQQTEVKNVLHVWTHFSIIYSTCQTEANCRNWTIILDDQTLLVYSYPNYILI